MFGGGGAPSPAPREWEVNNFHEGLQGGRDLREELIFISSKEVEASTDRGAICYLEFRGHRVKRGIGPTGWGESGPFLRTTNQYKGIWVEDVARFGGGVPFNLDKMIFVSLGPRRCLINVYGMIYFWYFFSPSY